MARSPETVVVRRKSGSAIPGAEITVADRSAAPVVIYDAEVGGNVIPQPALTDFRGALTFWHEEDAVTATVTPPGESPYSLPLGGGVEGGAAAANPDEPIGLALSLAVQVEISDEIYAPVDVYHHVRAGAFQLHDPLGAPLGGAYPGVAFYVEDSSFQNRNGAPAGAAWWYVRRDAISRIGWAGSDAGAGNFRDTTDPGFIEEEPPPMPPTLDDVYGFITEDGWYMAVEPGWTVMDSEDFGHGLEPCISPTAPLVGPPYQMPVVPVRTIIAVKAG